MNDSTRSFARGRFVNRFWNLFSKSKESPDPTRTTPKIRIGKDGRLEVLSFSAAGFDGILYLGTIHALLVTQRHPDVIAGISSGAIAAVMAAEILQAGEGGRVTSAQIARFRELLGIARELPNHIWRDLLPNMLELGSPAPLEPLRSPVLPEEEREERSRAVNARHGLLLLYNGILSSRMKVSRLTRLVRCALDLPQISAWQCKWLWRMLDRGPYTRGKVRLGNSVDQLGRGCQTVWTCVRLWLESFWPAMIDARLIAKSVWATAVGWHVAELRKCNQSRRKRSFINTLRARLLFRRDPRNARDLLFSRGARLCQLLLTPLGYSLVFAGWLAALPIALAVWGGSKLNRFKATRILLALGLSGLFFILLCATFWFTGQAWLVFIVWGAAALFVLVTFGAWHDLRGSFLAYFDLKADISTSYIARLLFVKAFDPGYFGKTELTDILTAALTGEDAAKPQTNGSEQKKLLSCYLYSKCKDRIEPRPQPILVLPVAANVGSGQIEAADPRESVVDALCAATALVPFFRAQPLQYGKDPKWDGRSWFIDGSNIAPEPHLPVLETIKRIATEPSSAEGIELADLKSIQILAVSPDPIDQALRKERDQQWKDTFASQSANLDRQEPESEDHGQLIENVFKVLQMHRLQAAKDERLLLEIYAKALAPFEKPIVEIQDSRSENRRTFIAAQIVAVEPGQTPNVWSRLIKATDDQPASEAASAAAIAETRRQIVGETIAEGCRMTMERLYETELRDFAGEQQASEGHVACADFIEKKLGRGHVPGALRVHGPGLVDVCRWCSLARSGLPGGAKLKGRLQYGAPKPEFSGPAIGQPLKASDAGGNNASDDHSRPLTSIVFAGGVFRGVFQVGVINALNEVGLKPDIVAGASIGTIMSAITATILAQRPNWTYDDRVAQMRALAASFLSIDRLVLTDRLADFIRRLTLRLGKADFSFHDADSMFRRFGRHSWESFSAACRQVLSGLEQIFFLDPKDLLDLTLAARQKDLAGFTHLMRRHAQEYLDRSGIGAELLGAEPLELLIRHHVFKPLQHDIHAAAHFDLFKRFGIEFLATVTNLTTQQLDLLSSCGREDRRPELLQGLLASSAFPGVFRPRWSWEIRAITPWELCVDGGVTDNLPLVPVSRFIYYSTLKGLASPAPCLPGTQWSPDTATPHLLFSASLEVTPSDLTTPNHSDRIGALCSDWTRLRKRAARLRHNKKIDRFIQFQHDLRMIRAALPDPQKGTGLTDIYPISVKPQWLCGTFAFHPMLGFKKIEQARSMAHGCASTFGQLYIEEQQFGPRARAWWQPLDIDPKAVIPPPRPELPPKLDPQPRTDGKCWFRNHAYCPFSPQRLEAARLDEQKAASAEKTLTAPIVRELASIYWECGKALTHSRRE